LEPLLNGLHLIPHRGGGDGQDVSHFSTRHLVDGPSGK
jgi:hypothetical protein